MLSYFFILCCIQFYSYVIPIVHLLHKINAIYLGKFNRNALSRWCVGTQGRSHIEEDSDTDMIIDHRELSIGEGTSNNTSAASTPQPGFQQVEIHNPTNQVKPHIQITQSDESRSTIWTNKLTVLTVKWKFRKHDSSNSNK